MNKTLYLLLAIALVGFSACAVTTGGSDQTTTEGCSAYDLVTDPRSCGGGGIIPDDSGGIGNGDIVADNGDQDSDNVKKDDDSSSQNPRLVVTATLKLKQYERKNLSITLKHYEGDDFSIVFDSDPSIEISKESEKNYRFEYTITGLKAGTYKVGVKAVKGDGTAIAGREIKITVTPNPLVNNTQDEVEMLIGEEVRLELKASGGSGGYQWIANYDSPLSIKVEDDKLHVKADKLGDFTFTTTVTDSRNNTAVKEHDVFVREKIEVETRRHPNQYEVLQVVVVGGKDSGYSCEIGEVKDDTGQIELIMKDIEDEKNNGDVVACLLEVDSNKLMEKHRIVFKDVSVEVRGNYEEKGNITEDIVFEIPFEEIPLVIEINEDGDEDCKLGALEEAEVSDDATTGNRTYNNVEMRRDFCLKFKASGGKAPYEWTVIRDSQELVGDKSSLHITKWYKEKKSAEELIDGENNNKILLVRGHFSNLNKLTETLEISLLDNSGKNAQKTIEFNISKGKAVKKIIVYTQTGELDGAGTDSTIKASFCRDSSFQNCSVNDVELDDPNDDDDRERGDLNTYTISVDNNNVMREDIRYFQFRSNGGGDKPSWFLQGVEVEFEYNDNTREVIYINPAVHRWVRDGDVLKFSPYDTAILAIIRTGDKDDGGTDSSVYMYWRLKAPNKLLLQQALINNVNKVDPYLYDPSDMMAEQCSGSGPCIIDLTLIAFALNHKDHDDRERNTRVSYGVSMFDSDLLADSREFSIEIMGSDAWYLDGLAVFVYHPGSVEFLKDGSCAAYVDPNVNNAQGVWLSTDEDEGNKQYSPQSVMAGSEYSVLLDSVMAGSEYSVLLDIGHDGPGGFFNIKDDKCDNLDGINLNASSSANCD